ncbi:MAG: L-histidine N(alpha)-methyltransferase [Flavobacteriales bacterium]
MRTSIEVGTDEATAAFRRDVIEGLTQVPKRIGSRYFYDAEGDRLFQAIMASPDYYVTRAEEEILRDQTDAVLEALVNGHARFSLFELGAGDGTKTKHLLRRALDQGRDPLYRPIDISEHVLDELGTALKKELPTLRFQAEQGEYFEAIRRTFTDPGEAKAVIFLGSNIGNLTRERAIELLKGVGDHLGPNDRFLVGFDRKKDPAIILRAYNDRAGITRDFNLNLLRRMNRELGTDFDLDGFVHAPVYCPATGRALSYIVSTRDQVVHMPGVDAPIAFKAWEALHTEISQKYDRTMIEDLAHHAGLRITATFTDDKGYFTDVVFAPNNGRT